MSYLVDKLDLKKNRLYRKVKLDIDEVMDKFEAIEEIGVDMDIYGDNEGYFFVKKKEDDKYLVKFLNLDLLVGNKIITIDISPKGNKIDMFSINDIQKLDMISTEELDFDEMDENYVRLDLPDIVRELIEQANSKGKKGIKLDIDYLEKYSKELGEKKTKPITLNDTEIDFIGNYETPIPDSVFNKIDLDKLRKRVEINYFESPKNPQMRITMKGEIPVPMSRLPQSNPVYYTTGKKDIRMIETFEEAGMPENLELLAQLLRIMIFEKKGIKKFRTPIFAIQVYPNKIVEKFLEIIKNTNRFNSISKKLTKYFKNNIKNLYDYGALFNSEFNFFEYSTKEKIVEAINKIIKSNISIDELSAFIEYYKENIMNFQEASEEFGGYGDYDEDKLFDLVPPEIKKEIIGEGKNNWEIMPKSEFVSSYFNINTKKLKEQYDKKYSASNGKKYMIDNNLEFKVDKPKKDKDKTEGKKKLNIAPYRFEYDKDKLFEEFDFKFAPELKGLLT